MNTDDVRYFSSSCPSICIPCVSNSISQTYIYNVFQSLKLGNIKKIDYFKTNKGFKKVFIVFDQWFSGKIPTEIKTKLLNNETIYLEYMSGVWKCKNANRSF